MMRTALDHLVIACSDLDQGTDWLRARLGVESEPGGRHASMGTHNRLLRLGPRAYMELIALDPDAEPPPHPRWFGLDEREVRARSTREPFLLTWVAATDDVQEAVARIPELGDVSELSWDALRWRIALPEGGSLLHDGVMPALIQWLGGTHPCDRLEDRGCELQSLALQHPSATEIAVALQMIGFDGWDALEVGPKRLAAVIRGPSGEITLS